MAATVAERNIASTMHGPQPGESQRVSRLTLAAVPSAVTSARLLVQHSLLDWNVDRRVLAAVEEATAELVHHAVKTTGVSDPQPMYGEVVEDLSLIKVRVRLLSEQLVIEVWDGGPEPLLDDLSRSDALAASRDWGFDFPTPGHRVVWAAFLAAPNEPDAETVSLPRVRRSTPRTPGERPAAVMRDPEVLRAVLNGLRRLGGETEPQGRTRDTSSEGSDEHG
ncbi:MAG: hypothetical protein WBA97_31040 [Actinophytocola sp.]|uniref:ATP-binding protein n=1 Tax=Actinophytocola sp. TaxID=1872138 RepID=UPI003C71BA1B